MQTLIIISKKLRDNGSNNLIKILSWLLLYSFFICVAFVATDRPNLANNTQDPPFKIQKFYHRLTEKNCKPQREGGKRGFQPQ